jgi:hypothetical protein
MPQEPEAAINVETAFALLVEGAAEQFDILQELISGNLVVQCGCSTDKAARSLIYMRASPTIQMALAKAFLFNAARAYRILEHGSDQITISRVERKQFMNSLRPIISVRDVNEHGFDPVKGPRQKESRPAMHVHADEQVFVDETAMVILGPKQILMGPLNLVDIGRTVKRMREVAGFSVVKARNP